MAGLERDIIFVVFGKVERITEGSSDRVIAVLCS